MKTIITGGTGFVGNNLARELVSRGDRVGLLIREKSETWRINDLSGKIDFLESDLMDRKGLIELVQSYNPDFIYHFGSYGVSPKFQQDEDIMLSVNVGGTLNLLEAAESIPIINVGSSSEYGTKNGAMIETDNCRPNNRYGETKLMQTLYCSEQGIPTLRLSSIYGPWEEPTRLIPTLIKSKLTSGELHLIDSVRDYVHVDDVIGAFLRATEKYDQIGGEIINIGSGQQYSMHDILRELDDVDPTELDISWDFEAVQTEPAVWFTDISKAERTLEWVPEISLKEGLKRTYRWYQRSFGGNSQ